VASGALNHDATPLSVLVKAPETATAGGTTLASRVVRGMRGAVVAVVEGAAGAGLVVVVDPGTAVVVVTALLIVVVVVGRGWEVDVVDRARISWTRSGREMAPADEASSMPGAGVCGAVGPPDTGDDPAAEPTRIAVEVSPEGFLRLRSPATRVTRHSTATYDDRVFPRLPVSCFPACQPPAKSRPPGTRRL
jgi:hypothetical protein